MPAFEFGKFATHFQTKYKDVTCLLDEAHGNCYFFGPCAAREKEFSPFILQLADTKGFSIPASSYLIDKKTQQGQDGCLIGVQRSKDNDFVLGEVFIQNYYTVLDFENKRVGFNGDLFVEGLPLKKFPLWAIIVIAVAGAGIVLAIAICVVVRHRNKNLKSKLGEYNEIPNKNTV